MSLRSFGMRLRNLGPRGWTKVQHVRAGFKFQNLFSRDQLTIAVFYYGVQNWQNPA